jgi:pimeloyl-ACP methyl ester carboxylesterase
MTAPLEFTKSIVDFFGRATVNTLVGVRDVLSGSLSAASSSLAQLTDKPLVRFTNFQEAIKKASEQLGTANHVTSFGLATAIQAVTEAFDRAGEGLQIADEFTHKSLFENVYIGSTAGTSFDALLKTQIEASFRLNGQDVSAAAVAEDFRASGLSKPLLLVPGLFCDDSMWNAGNQTYVDFFREKGYYPVLVRLHPGLAISENGKKLFSLLDQWFDQTNEKLHVMAYSNGGLILRSALYLAGTNSRAWAGSIGRVAFISPPDGGSYIEKIGFWLGAALRTIPSFGMQILGWIGHMRSDAMKDLSHGIIREEDRNTLHQISRYTANLYHGELDSVDAYLVYSLISDSNDPIRTWLGDGVCEKRSLEYLRDSVYLKKTDPEKRIHVISGKSHFQILGSPEIWPILDSIY